MARVRQDVLDRLGGPVPNGRVACLAPQPKVTVTGVGFFVGLALLVVGISVHWSLSVLDSVRFVPLRAGTSR